jgi:hypothetical protein
VATAIEHESRVSGKHNNNKQRQQPNCKIGTLRMTTMTAKRTIFAYLFAARFATFKKWFIHFLNLTQLFYLYKSSFITQDNTFHQK